MLLMQAGDSLTDVLRLSECCGCKVNWAAASYTVNTKQKTKIAKIKKHEMQSLNYIIFELAVNIIS